MAFAVMEHVFAIHNEFGRFFDERIYKRELANRFGGVELEVAVDITHGTFAKRYFADVLVNGSGLFEFKAVDAIHVRHIGQEINYLLLLDLAHGKVINVRPERVQSRFVNCHQQLVDLRRPLVRDSDFDASAPSAEQFRATLLALLHDWGAGLELNLYDEAITHFLGGEEAVIREIPVYGNNGMLGLQRLRFAAPDVAYQLTSLAAGNTFAIHARRMLQHTGLKAIHWANITPQDVTFTTIR